MVQEVDWIHQPRPARRTTTKYAVKFVRGVCGYQAGEIAGFPLDRAYQMTRGVSVKDAAGMDPDKLPNAIIIDKDAFVAAMAEDDKRRDDREQVARKIAAKRANKAIAAADKAKAAADLVSDQNRRARECRDDLMQSKPTDHDKLVARRRKQG